MIEKRNAKKRIIRRINHQKDQVLKTKMVAETVLVVYRSMTVASEYCYYSRVSSLALYHDGFRIQSTSTLIYAMGVLKGKQRMKLQDNITAKRKKITLKKRVWLVW